MTGFCTARCPPVLGHDPTFYDVRTIRAAFAHWAHIQSSSTLSNTATALRGYVRYLAVNGLCRPALADAVPTVRRQRAADLPRYVNEAAVEALIASCNTATPAGMRDRAILLLLARLALQAGDVVALRLGDIDWERARARVGWQVTPTRCSPTASGCRRCRQDLHPSQQAPHAQ